MGERSGPVPVVTCFRLPSESRYSQMFVILLTVRLHKSVLPGSLHTSPVGLPERSPTFCDSWLVIFTRNSETTVEPNMLSLPADTSTSFPSGKVTILSSESQIGRASC